MKIKVDWDLCEANGLCMGAAPEVFDLDDKDNLTVLIESPSEEMRTKVEDAA